MHHSAGTLQSDAEREVVRQPSAVTADDTISGKAVIQWDVNDLGPSGSERWFKSALYDVRDLLTLRPNWDSYGAPTIDDDVAWRAVQALRALARAHTPRPRVVPVSSGGIDFEWYKNGLEVHLALEPGTHIIGFFYRQLDGKREWEGEATDPASDLEGVFEKLREGN